MVNDNELLQELKAVTQKLRDIKGEERNPRARAIAVTVTMLEKAMAYFFVYVIDGNAE